MANAHLNTVLGPHYKKCYEKFKCRFKGGYEMVQGCDEWCNATDFGPGPTYLESVRVF